MTLKEQNQIIMSQSSLNLEQYGEVPMSNSRLILFNSLRVQPGFNRYLKYSNMTMSEIRKYVNVSYVEVTSDVTKEGKAVKSYKYNDAKLCDKDDFNKLKKSSKSYLDSWKGSQIFCINYTNSDYKLYNNIGAQKSKGIQFKISRCKNIPGQKSFCQSS